MGTNSIAHFFGLPKSEDLEVIYSRQNMHGLACATCAAQQRKINFEMRRRRGEKERDPGRGEIAIREHITHTPGVAAHFEHTLNTR